ncbi:MAG: exodeoxyribonuclease VII large subunit [Phycisphaerales bacterium]
MNRKDRTPSDTHARGLSVSKNQKLTVSQLAARIESSIKSSFPSKIQVVAEISSVTNRTHYYFTLKDESSVISAVLFASAAKRLRTPPAHGQKVIAHGKLDYYAPSGRISFIVDKLEPIGQGDLEERYKALCDDLRARGWFDPLTKKTLPMFPRSIAIITSATGAALQDVLDTSAKRCPAVNMLVIDARVQGPHAKSQVASAIENISAQRDTLGVDAIILTRGGGSLEDLWAFNEPIVARAIHSCAVPIVAAIGHETDTTIAELVADERAATPTQAAMKLVPDRVALMEQIDALTRRINRELTTTISQHSSTLDRFSRSGPLANPAKLIEPYAIKLPGFSHRLQSACNRVASDAARQIDTLALRLSRHQPAAVHATRVEHISSLDTQLKRAIQSRVSIIRTSLEASSRQLGAIGPRRVLSRGYSLTTTKDGAVVRDSGALQSGQIITTHLHDGSVDSAVVGPKNRNQDPDQTRQKPSIRSNASKSKSPQSAKPKTKPKTKPTNEPSLFAPKDDHHG